MTDLDQRVRAEATAIVNRMQVDAFGGFVDAVALIAVQLADATGCDLDRAIEVAVERLHEAIKDRGDLAAAIARGAEAVDPRNDPANRRPGCTGGSWCRCDVSTPCYPMRRLGPLV